MRQLVGATGPNAETFPALRGRPLAFLYSYISRHPAGHLTVLLSVLVAVTCSVSTQYGMKYLIDIVATGREAAGDKVWGAFALLCGLVAADNLFWRVGAYAAHRTFVAVTGDIRRDLFRHLGGHAPTYFAERLPGALASRVTSTANAAFHVENTAAWNVLPPSVAAGACDCLHRFGQSGPGRHAAGNRARCSARSFSISPGGGRSATANMRERPPRWTGNLSISSAISTSSEHSARRSGNSGGSTSGWGSRWPRAGAACIIWNISGWCMRS